MGVSGVGEDSWYEVASVGRRVEKQLSLLESPLTVLPASTQVRRSDPDTSQRAALTLCSVTAAQRRVLTLLSGAPDGLTDAELLSEWERVYGSVPESTPRKRRCDLVRLGRVSQARDAETGAVTKRMIDGSQRIVWVRCVW